MDKSIELGSAISLTRHFVIYKKADIETSVKGKMYTTKQNYQESISTAIKITVERKMVKKCHISLFPLLKMTGSRHNESRKVIFIRNTFVYIKLKTLRPYATSTNLG